MEVRFRWNRMGLYYAPVLIQSQNISSSLAYMPSADVTQYHIPIAREKLVHSCSEVNPGFYLGGVSTEDVTAHPYCHRLKLEGRCPRNVHKLFPFKLKLTKFYALLKKKLAWLSKRILLIYFYARRPGVHRVLIPSILNLQNVHSPYISMVAYDYSV